MKNIIALGGSISKNSINKALASHAARLVNQANVEVLDLNDFPLPIYSVDHEGTNGVPENATKLSATISAADGIILSLAEHNGSFTAGFKNTVDWLSRIDPKLWKEKPMLLLATSPGPRGAANVLEHAKNIYPHQGAKVIAEFSLPSYYDHFSDQGIKDESLNTELQEKIALFEKALA